MGREAWDALTDKEQEHELRVHLLDCSHHMRNIFLKEMSAAMAKHVAAELAPHLEAFSAWERMSTEFSQLLRAAYKELHQRQCYYKGKGTEYAYWLKEKHATAFTVHFERAEGGRQDLDYDAAVPLYINRKYMVEFLHNLVYTPNHSNILEDFLYITFTAVEYLAMTRANAIIDLAISRPLRWLAGNSPELDNWSPVDMNGAFDLVYDVFDKAVTDGALLLDPNLDIFKPIADKQPLFAAWRKYMYEKESRRAADGKTEHLVYKLVRDELYDPQDPSNKATRDKTIEYLEVQVQAGLRKLRDPKLAIAKKLTALGGTECVGASEQARTDTMGLEATNDKLAETVFGTYDMVLRRIQGISMEAASAVAQAIRAKSFAPGGYADLLPRKELEALIEWARMHVREHRAVDRADHRELDEYHARRRKTNSEMELDALIKEYAMALSFFDKWSQRGARSVAEIASSLRGLATEQLKLDWLREQVEMRTRGLDFVEFRTRWSSGQDENIGTVADLTAHLKEIITEEKRRRSVGELHKEAAVPTMRRKTYKELGTPTVQVAALAGAVRDITGEELLQLAQKKREELEATGELSAVSDRQPKEVPKREDSLVGAKLEVNWRYWVVSEETGKRTACNMWCEGEVVAVANGTTDAEGTRSRKVLESGAVRIKWPKDDDFDEDETFTWSILTDANFNKERHMGWRLAAAELKKRAESSASAPPTKRARC